MKEPTIKVVVNGKNAEMTLTDAREMYEQLRRVFEEKRDGPLEEIKRLIRDTPMLPIPTPTIPHYPPFPQPSIPGNPPLITWCGSVANEQSLCRANPMSAFNS